MKYIRIKKYKNKKYYRIDKCINGKTYSFGSFKNLEDTIKHRNYLIQHDWDIKYAKQRKNSTGEKYITKVKMAGKEYYQLQKNIDGIRKVFGTYKTLQEAITAKQHYINNGWNKTFHKYNKNPEDKYIIKIDGKYEIRKWVNGKLTIFGRFDTMEEAQAERDLIKKYDWNYTDMIEGEGT